jgi:hypothetical protein
VFVHLRKIGKVIDPRDGESKSKTKSLCFLKISRFTLDFLDDEVPEKIVRLAIGVEGGFQADNKKVVYEEQNTIVCLPNFDTFPLSMEN